MNLLLRPVRRHELPALARLHAACFPEDAWDSVALATIFAMPGTSGHVVCAEEDAIRGVLVDQCLGEEAEILTLGVALGARRQGVARALILDLFARARHAGIKHVMLEVAADNPAGLALYHSLGFAYRGRRQGYYRRLHGPSVDAWRLDREIAPHEMP